MDCNCSNQAEGKIVINTAYHRPKRNHGFSLVEIMVALVIGMIAMVVVLQIFSASEGNKRTTTGADDAQMGGAVALFGLQRDIRQSGYGIGALNLMGCGLQLRTGVTLNALAPVTINSSLVAAGDPNTDTLLIVYGNANGTTDGEVIDNNTQGQTKYTMKYIMTSAQTNDWVIAESVAPPSLPPSPCNLILDQVTGITGAIVTVKSGDANVTSGALYNLGQTPRVLAYAVRGGNLTVCDYTANDCSSPASGWETIAGNIASMRAEYGRDTSAPMDGTVDVYDQTAPAKACDWLRITAIRLVIVARNSQYDKSVVTASAPTWEDQNDSNAAPIDLSANKSLPTGATWQNYRYKVLQTIVPLRNVAESTWMGKGPGC
jgi:type IV pilus assembly protein PilW